MSRRYPLVILVVLCVLLAGCGISAEDVVATLTAWPTVTPLPTARPSPTNTPAPTSTCPPRPTAAIVYIEVTSTPTPTPLGPPTPTPNRDATATARAWGALTAPHGDGFFTVGVEIAPGRWTSTGSGTHCYWARLDSRQNILDNHYGSAGGTVTIRATDYEVEFNGCGTWEYLGPP